MLRLCLIIVTAIACIGAGATAAMVAYATVLHWPLSDINLWDSVWSGARWGVVGAALASAAILVAAQKHIWVAAVAAVLATWLVTYARIWWDVVSGLG